MRLNLSTSNVRNPLQVLKIHSISSTVYIAMYFYTFYQWDEILFQIPLG